MDTGRYLHISMDTDRCLEIFMDTGRYKTIQTATTYRLLRGALLAPSVFFEHTGACRRRTPRACIDPKVPKDASHRDSFDAALRSDLAPRRPPSACPKKVVQNRFYFSDYSILGQRHAPKKVRRRQPRCRNRGAHRARLVGRVGGLEDETREPEQPLRHTLPQE